MVKLFITVKVDNVGAFFSTNVITTSWTKHIEIKYKEVNDCAEDGMVRIIFIKSADDDSDISTKNLNEEDHTKHTSKIGEKDNGKYSKITR